MKADAGYSHFFGDTEGVTRLQLGKNGGWAEIEGSELKGLFNVGLGVTAQEARSATGALTTVPLWALTRRRTALMPR